MNSPNKALSPLIDAPPEFESDTRGYPDVANTRGLDEPSYIIRLRLLWGERRFLARVLGYGLALATLVAFIIPVRYKSTIRLMPPDNQSTGIAMTAMMAAKDTLGSMGGMGGSLAGIAGDLLGLKNSSALFVDMLQGRSVQDRLVQRFDLRKEYRDRYWKDARKDLAKRTDINVDRKSDVMTISVEDRSPQRAQQMSEAYVEELDRLLSEVSTSAARRERIFIEQRLQTVKQEVDRTSKDFSEYSSQNTVLDMPYQAKAMVEAAAQLQGQLIAAQSQLDALEQIYTSNNVRVRSLKARVDELKKQLSKMGGVKGNSDTEPDANVGSDSSAGDLYPPIRKLPLVGVRWLDLYREAKIQETVYELLTKEYEIAKIQEAKEIPTVKILDPADIPEKYSFPPRTLIVVFGTLISFILGMVVILGTAQWKEIDPRSPMKQFANQTWEEMRQDFIALRANGSNPRNVLARRWKIGSHKQNSTD